MYMYVCVHMSVLSDILYAEGNTTELPPLQEKLNEESPQVSVL